MESKKLLYTVHILEYIRKHFKYNYIYLFIYFTVSHEWDEYFRSHTCALILMQTAPKKKKKMNKWKWSERVCCSIKQALKVRRGVRWERGESIVRYNREESGGEGGEEERPRKRKRWLLFHGFTYAMLLLFMDFHGLLSPCSLDLVPEITCSC